MQEGRASVAGCDWETSWGSDRTWLCFLHIPYAFVTLDVALNAKASVSFLAPGLLWGSSVIMLMKVFCKCRSAGQA